MIQCLCMFFEGRGFEMLFFSCLVCCSKIGCGCRPYIDCLICSLAFVVGNMPKCIKWCYSVTECYMYIYLDLDVDWCMPMFLRIQSSLIRIQSMLNCCSKQALLGDDLPSMGASRALVQAYEQARSTGVVMFVKFLNRSCHHVPHFVCQFCNLVHSQLQHNHWIRNQSLKSDLNLIEYHSESL